MDKKLINMTQFGHLPGPPKPFLNELTLEDIEQTGINLTEARRIVFNTSSFPAREMFNSKRITSVM